LDAYIKKHGLIPRSLDEQKDIKEENIDSIDFKK